MGQYSFKRTLAKHGDPLNALAFLYGSLFGSVADDGLAIISIFKGNGNTQELCQFQVKVP